MIDRSRIGRGHVRAEIAREAKRAARPAVVVVAVMALGIVCLAYLVLQIDAPALIGTRQIAFAVDNANGVQPGLDEVRFKGIPAGKITGLSLRGVQPVITVALDDSYGRVYRNATAALRPNTPLQDMYLDILSRGTPSAGPASSSRPVPSDRTDTSIAISDVLDVFSGQVRERFAHVLNDLGNGLADRGARLRTAFVDAVPFVQLAGQITGELNSNAGMTRQLVHNTGVMMSALASRQQQLRTLVAQGSSVADSLQVRSDAIDATLQDLPSTLTDADAAFTAVRGVLPGVDGALESLYPVARRLPDALQEIEVLTAAATPAVQALQEPVQRLVPLADRLVPVSTSLDNSATRLRPQIPPVNRLISDVAGCLPSLSGFFAWDASMTKFADSRGPAPRGNVAFGLDQTGALGSPFEFAFKSCSPGEAIPGRLPQPSDQH
jgi:virulence factor Mce-like protein